MYHLKTGCYTVDGPIRLGALLAGASEARLGVLSAFTHPVGIAFQLRDDLIGAFGDPGDTGKPAGSDFRQGKRTLLVMAAEHDPEAKRLLEQVRGREDEAGESVAALLDRLEAIGARAEVEARLEACAADALHRLQHLPVTPEARDLLAGAVAALVWRRS